MRTLAMARLALVIVVCGFAIQTAVSQSVGRHGTPQFIPAGPLALTGTPLPAGTYTVGTGGYFPTLDSAFNRLSGGGILGSVTLSLTDSLYVAPDSKNGTFLLLGPVSGAGPASRITLRPADNKAVMIQGKGEATLSFHNVSFLTLDGISVGGKTGLSIHALYNITGTRWNDCVDFIGNDDFDVVSNITVSSDDRRGSTGVTLSADSLGAPDSCLVTGVFVKSSMFGIILCGLGPDYTFRPRGNIIRNNKIGSPVDSLISWGIQDEGANGTIIESNEVQHLRLTYTPPADITRHIGINVYFGRYAIVRNNFVHNLFPIYNEAEREGILASGSYNQRGSSVWIYNNMVYDMRTGMAAEGTPALAGIAAWDQDLLMVDHNSVHLTGPSEGSAHLVSAAAWTDPSVMNPTFRNNILVNTRNDPGCAALRIDSSPWGSNNNDLYVDPSGNGVIGRWSSQFYKTLADWRTNGSDNKSVSFFPAFCDLPCLHIDSKNSSSKLLDSAGMSIPGIAYDFDGEKRNFLTPDIGADEFDITNGIASGGTPGIPDRFTLAQNFPNPFNPSTTIRYGLPHRLPVLLVVFNLLGQRVVTLVDEYQDAGYYDVRFDGSELASGNYFYRLQAGDFVSTKGFTILK